MFFKLCSVFVCITVVYSVKENYLERPALRHHIAHFCPNLDIARTCIRKCMKLGKPAFCGKDHQCYCGHKYNKHSKDKKTDITQMYAEFKDMYEKYFGTGYKELEARRIPKKTY